MAECYTCRRSLHNSWNIITLDLSCDIAKRYLNINDDHLLYTGSSNCMFCYCNPCWQKYILALSLISSAKQINTLKEQNYFLQQQLTILKQKHTSLQQQHTSLQNQLINSQVETIFYKNQLNKINEKYNKLSNISGITIIRDLINQLTSSQIDDLHSHTTFRVDTSEAMYNKEQFTMPIIKQLKSSVDIVVELKKNILIRTKQSKEKIFQTLITDGVSQAIREASIKPLEIEIKEIETNIQRWNLFLANLTNDIEQRTNFIDIDLNVKIIDE